MVLQRDADSVAGALVGREINDGVDGRAGVVGRFGVALEIDLSYKTEPWIVAS